MRLKVSIWLGVYCLIMVPTVVHADNPNVLQWQSVDRLRGNFKCQEVSVKSHINSTYFEKGYQEDISVGNFVLFRGSVPNLVSNRDWITEEAMISGHHSNAYEDGSSWRQLRTTEYVGFSAPVKGVSFNIDYTDGSWMFNTGSKFDIPYIFERSVFLREERDGVWVTESSTDTLSSDHYADSNIYGVLPDGKPGPLSGTWFKSEEMPDYWINQYEKCRVSLTPEYFDFKVVVEFDAYDDKEKQISYENWRPLGSIKEPGRAGNYIDVKAVLHSKGDNKSAASPKVKYFRFELVDTSQEPGIAMNWPPNAKDKYPDMRLVVNLASLGQPDKEGQSLVVSNPVKDAEGRPAAMARINSYDFGGRTELKVTVELEDGRELFGELESGDLNYNEIRIPKRDYGKWVADAWRIEHDVGNLPDDSDDESKPEGDGDKGDGLTLYEEYRGFAAKRMKDGRVEGDPKLKDLFILNLAGKGGADGWQGIQMFEDATGLRVIARLVKPEIREKDRVVNRNYDKAPHMVDKEGKPVDQHGLVLKTLNFKQMGHHGAQAFGNFAKALKPKTVTVVGVPARNDPEADTNQPHNLPTDDIASAYERTLAHELLHAVSVAHHGQGDHCARFTYIPTAYKGNPTSRAIFSMEEFDYKCETLVRTAVVDVLEEKTRVSWAKRIGPAFDYILEQLATNKVAADNLPAGTTFRDLDRTAQWSLIVQLPNFVWGIGVEHGQHSGYEQCLMRYEFAKLYKARGAQALGRETYYLVPQGTEDVGAQICKEDKGTGVNAPSWMPQSRYGDAANNFGKCMQQICVNDAIPLHDWGWKR